MSVKIMGLVWDLDNSVIDREEKYVLLAYVDHADHSGNNIFPSIDLICQKTGYKERAAQMITKSLVQKGFLLSDGKGPKGTNKWKYGGGAKNAGVQPNGGGGASSRQDGGALAIAPESSEPPPLKPSKRGASANPQPPKVKASDIPELVLFKNIALTYCKPHQRDLVINAVRAVEKRIGHFPTEDDLKPYWDQWRQVSGNVFNLTWLTEWAVTGRTNGSTPKPATNYSKNEDIVRRWMAGQDGANV